MKGADILKVAPRQYSSTVEYPATSIADNLKAIAMVHLADLGTRVFYCDHGGFDTHATQTPVHAKLWSEVSEAVTAFLADLKQHDAADNLTLLLFSEFGRRCRDNGSGTDHGSAGVAFLVGEKVKGGQYSEYPSTRLEALDDGDLVANVDFRSVYAELLEKVLNVQARAVMKGSFEQLNCLN